MKIKTYGSLCSGIEAASFVLSPMGLEVKWLSEIADFQSRFLKNKYPKVVNVGDMIKIPTLIENDIIDSPDLVCGGTPCQAFSLAGWRNGINDERGVLTLKYIDIINAIDNKRLAKNLDRTIFFWENVEGALTDKTNAFGCFISGLLGLEKELPIKKWPSAGFISGKYRNIAWRVLDAKYFGVPQQRRRVYLLGGGKNFNPEKVLFEVGNKINDPLKISIKEKTPSLFDDFYEQELVQFKLKKTINLNIVEAFRSYSDCLYAAYGTKWNGNAAANNGSLFFAQNGRLRRLSPRECERLMGFPDDYTFLPNCKDTQRYHAIGNSWAVPVIKWIMKRLISEKNNDLFITSPSKQIDGTSIYLLNDFSPTIGGEYVNASKMPYNYVLTNMVDIADVECPEKFYITPQGCAGILRRKYKYNTGMNERLEQVLIDCAGDENYK